MGLILPQEVDMTISGSSQKYYENLGYNIPKSLDNQKRTRTIQNTKIKVHILDLPKNSNIKVKVQCDICGKISELQYSKYNNNIKRNGIYQCDNKTLHTKIQAKNKLKLLIKELKIYLKANSYFPKLNDFTIENGFTYTYYTAENICKLNNTSIKDVMCGIDCFKSTKPSKTYYNKYLEKLLEVINSTNLGTNLYGLSRTNDYRKYNLPNIRWFIEHCPDKNVCDMSSFKKWAGIYENYLSKDQCKDIILKMSEEFNRPLMYDDFRGSGYGHVSIHMINNYWGSLNKMKEALGLEIIQESMIDKVLSKEETEKEIAYICNYIKQDGRNFTTTREISKISNTVTSGTLRRLIKKYFNVSLSDYFNMHNINLGKEGCGISFNFDDGEKVVSQFEYIFSKYLKEFGLVYNNDYFRNVKYKDFIPNYKGNMNCDYVINYNNKTIYIEIAGIIEAYKLWYYEDKTITVSKSKEKYRLKLKEKEKMLKNNNLIYFILFPCDLTRDIFMQIIQEGSLELKHNIERFMKNNIDWVKIQNIGELKYKENITSCYGQLVVDYR